MEQSKGAHVEFEREHFSDLLEHVRQVEDRYPSSLSPQPSSFFFIFGLFS